MYRPRLVKDFFHQGQVNFFCWGGTEILNQTFYLYNGLKPEEYSAVGQKGHMPLMNQIREEGIFSPLNMPTMKKTSVSLVISCPLLSLVSYATRAYFFLRGRAIMLLMKIFLPLL